MKQTVYSKEEFEAYAATAPNGTIRPYDPTTEHRVVRLRLHALDMINERFSRSFRAGLFGLMGLSTDITPVSTTFESFAAYEASLKGHMSLNIVSMKPLRSNAMFAFSPNLVFMIVNNIFGGPSGISEYARDREFRATEQRIIDQMMGIAIDAYSAAWDLVYPLTITPVRSDTLARFTNLTNAPTEIVVRCDFFIEFGKFSENFSIVIPLSAIEPIKDRLVNIQQEQDETEAEGWGTGVKKNVKNTRVELVTNYVYIDTTLNKLWNLKVGDILEIEQPTEVTSEVDGVPVLTSTFGALNGNVALRVKNTLNHALFQSQLQMSNETEHEKKTESSYE